MSIELISAIMNTVSLVTMIACLVLIKRRTKR